jgi:hypothetical protein
MSLGVPYETNGGREGSIGNVNVISVLINKNYLHKKDIFKKASDFHDFHLLKDLEDQGKGEIIFKYLTEPSSGMRFVIEEQQKKYEIVLFFMKIDDVNLSPIISGREIEQTPKSTLKKIDDPIEVFTHDKLDTKVIISQTEKIYFMLLPHGTELSLVTAQENGVVSNLKDKDINGFIKEYQREHDIKELDAKTITDILSIQEKKPNPKNKKDSCQQQIYESTDYGSTCHWTRVEDNTYCHNPGLTSKYCREKTLTSHEQLTTEETAQKIAGSITANINYEMSRKIFYFTREKSNKEFWISPLSLFTDKKPQRFDFSNDGGRRLKVKKKYTHRTKIIRSIKKFPSRNQKKYTRYSCHFKKKNNYRKPARNKILTQKRK